MTHEVRSPATAAVRSMSIDFICKTRNEIVAVNAFCPISTFSVCDELGTLSSPLVHLNSNEGRLGLNPLWYQFASK